MRVIVHCIGVSPEGVIFQRFKHNPLQWLCVQWNNLSAGLTSPFFEYELELQEHEDRYIVEQWHSVQCRLPQDGGDCRLFGKKARECLQQSFYPLLLRPSSEDMVVEREQYWPWEMRQKPLGTQCNEPAWWNKTHTVTGREYWQWHQKRHKEQVKPLLDSLELKFCNSLATLYGALEKMPRQQQHWIPYLRHRLLEMDSLFTVCCHNDWLQLPIATFSLGTVQDLARLHQQFRQLARGGRLRETAKNPPSYVNLASLLRHTLTGKLALMIQHYLPTQSPLVKEQLMDQILVRGMMETFETQALSDQSTCFPITFKSLHWHYHSLVQLPHTDQDLQQLLPFNTDEEEESEFHRLVARFRHLAQTNNRQLAWYIVPIKGSLLLKPYTPLFVIHSRPDELSRERVVQKLWQELPGSRQIRVHHPPDSCQWNATEWRREYQQMDEIDRHLYRQRWTFLLFSPNEMVANQDLVQVQSLLQNDFYGTSLIKPAHNEWLCRRLERHFRHHCPQLEYEELHERLHSATDERAQRETVIVMDSHLYSYREMQTLLQWLNDAQQVKLVVMIGATDTHPLHCHGHAMLDLAQWHDRESIRTHIFAHQYRQSQFQELLLRVSSTTVHCISASHQLQDLLQQLLAEKKSLTLYIVDQITVTRKSSDLQQEVDENLSKKFQLAHNVTVERRGLDSLVQCHYTDEEANETRHVFITTRRFMQDLKRNELNHLLMEQDCMVIIGEKAKRNTHPLDWLAKAVERQTFPNLRHTLPFLRYCENVSRQQ